MVRIPAGIHKKIKHTNLETAANAAYVNKGTCYWAFTFIKFWRDEMKIDKDNTEYCYKMHNGRYVWSEDFLALIEEYCESHKDDFFEDE